MCKGQIEASFYEDDAQKIGKESKKSKSKLIDHQNNVSLHYLKLKKKRVFFEVKNNSKNDSMDAIFTINSFVEKKMNNNPYSEIS